VDVEISGGRSGSFEITRGERLLFSKLAEHRFPEDAEILHLLDTP
jgi:selT/selW/selH-like putative selenoprotein